MKRLIIVLVAGLFLITGGAAGCSQEAVVKGPEATVVSSCVTCHTDKDKLQEMAAPEPASEKSAETAGEG